MSNVFLENRWIKIIIRDRILRVTTALIIVLGIVSIGLSSYQSSYQVKIDANIAQIEDAELQLARLQEVLESEDSERDERVMGRNFAPYEEIIPFISLLEEVFALIDKKATITISDNEKQIYVNRYADYNITINPRNNIELFYKALDQLHTGPFITKVISFNMNYGEDIEKNTNELTSVNLVIRLYFE